MKTNQTKPHLAAHDNQSINVRCSVTFGQIASNKPCLALPTTVVVLSCYDFFF